MVSFKLDKEMGVTDALLKRFVESEISSILDQFGQKAVNALSAATPKDSGTTASSWSYKKVQTGSGEALEFHNSNVNDGVNIAVILQLGHGTGTGGYVVGIDYINPAVASVFAEIVDAILKEINSG